MCIKQLMVQILPTPNISACTMYTFVYGMLLSLMTLYLVHVHHNESVFSIALQGGPCM